MFFKLVRTIYVYKVYNCYVYKVSRSCLQSFAVMSTKFRGDKLSYYPYWDNISKFWSGCAVVFFWSITHSAGGMNGGVPPGKWKMAQLYSAGVRHMASPAVI